MVTVSFIRGLLLGLAMILPIGPQNLYVLTRGLQGGPGQGLLSAVVAGLCDTTLIVAGAAGLSVLFEQPLVRSVVIILGSLFLLHLGFGALTSRPDASTTTGRDPLPNDSLPLARVFVSTVAVSWGNPHAILDTVAVLGTAIAAQVRAIRLAFAGGTIVASWLFFAFLALSGSWLGPRLTPNARTWIDRASGLLMLAFAVLLARELFK